MCELNCKLFAVKPNKEVCKISCSQNEQLKTQPERAKFIQEEEEEKPGLGGGGEGEGEAGSKRGFHKQPELLKLKSDCTRNKPGIELMQPQMQVIFSLLQTAPKICSRAAGTQPPIRQPAK